MVYSKEKSMLRWRLRELMARSRITNRELAQYLSRHETSISRMKNSDTMPRMDGEELNSLCNALTAILRNRGQELVISHQDLLDFTPDTDDPSSISSRKETPNLKKLKSQNPMRQKNDRFSSDMHHFKQLLIDVEVIPKPSRCAASADSVVFVSKDGEAA
jgi:DNA-binding Xre family transcriptional regulator